MPVEVANPDEDEVVAELAIVAEVLPLLVIVVPVPVVIPLIVEVEEWDPRPATL